MQIFNQAVKKNSDYLGMKGVKTQRELELRKENQS